MRIIVCDDEKAPRDDWADAIRLVDKSFEVTQLGNHEAAVLNALVQRRFAFRESGVTDWPTNQIDEADVLVVDYDLTLIDRDARYTGEQLARLARLYSTCGYVVVMNQFPDVGFDLTLKGHLDSYADVNIDASLVGQPHLWGRSETGAFAPWHWDNIPKVTSSRQTLATNIAKSTGFDQTIVNLLVMPLSTVNRLGDTAFGFIDPDSTDAEGFSKKTIRDFLGKLSEHKDTSKLLVDKQEYAARTAVARIAKWISRVLLGPQDILIDVPHLLSRMPYLLNPNLPAPDSIEGWNRLIELGSEAIHDDVVAASAFASSNDWLGKQTFWWSEIENVDVVDTLRDSFDYDRLPDMVFAEDVSGFVSHDAATEFRAGFHNIYDRRYIARPDASITYAPRRRLTFASYE